VAGRSQIDGLLPSARLRRRNEVPLLGEGGPVAQPEGVVQGVGPSQLPFASGRPDLEIAAARLGSEQLHDAALVGRIQRIATDTVQHPHPSERIGLGVDVTERMRHEQSS
jgi:hypothetical protein